MVDKNFEKAIEKVFKTLKGKKIIFVTHQPPYGTLVDRIHGEQAGNKSYTYAIKRLQPKLVICGHLHENAGKRDKIGNTVIINPGWEGTILVV